MLFEHGFYLKSLNWALICMHDVTLECVAAVTDHFADAFVSSCFEKSSVRKGIFNV